MSLDDFQLPSFLISGLYKDSLVDLDSKQVRKKSLKLKDLLFLGENKKQVLIIVDDEDALYLRDSSLNFLIEILTACKLTIADTALVNFHKNPGINYQILMEQFTPSITLCLGIALQRLEFPMEFPDYQVQQYNGRFYLSAPSLIRLSTEKHEKLQLWNCLKKIFLK